MAFRDVVGSSPTKQQRNENRDGRPMTAPTEKYLFTIIYYLHCHLSAFQAPLLKERLSSVRLPLRGAVSTADCGVTTQTYLSYATSPPFRHLSSRRGLVWLHLRGAVNAVDCGVAFGTSRCCPLRTPTASDSLSHTKSNTKEMN